MWWTLQGPPSYRRAGAHCFFHICVLQFCQPLMVLSIDNLRIAMSSVTCPYCKALTVLATTALCTVTIMVCRNKLDSVNIVSNVQSNLHITVNLKLGCSVHHMGVFAHLCKK